MTRLNDYRHPATGMSEDELEDVVLELEMLLDRDNRDIPISPWTAHVLEITADQIREAEDCLDNGQDIGL